MAGSVNATNLQRSQLKEIIIFDLFGQGLYSLSSAIHMYGRLCSWLGLLLQQAQHLLISARMIPMVMGGKNVFQLDIQLFDLGQHFVRFDRIDDQRLPCGLVHQQVHVVVGQGWNWMDFHFECCRGQSSCCGRKDFGWKGFWQMKPQSRWQHPKCWVERTFLYLRLVFRRRNAIIRRKSTQEKTSSSTSWQQVADHNKIHKQTSTHAHPVRVPALTNLQWWSTRWHQNSWFEIIKVENIFIPKFGREIKHCDHFFMKWNFIAGDVRMFKSRKKTPNETEQDFVVDFFSRMVITVGNSEWPQRNPRLHLKQNKFKQIRLKPFQLFQLFKLENFQKLFPKLFGQFSCLDKRNCQTFDKFSSEIDFGDFFSVLASKLTLLMFEVSSWPKSSWSCNANDRL